MAGFFYQLGKLAGPKVRKAKWFLRSLTGSEAEAIQAEFEVGRDLSHAMSQSVEVERDPHIVEGLGELGKRLAACLRNPHRKFCFQSFRSDEPNALALPGGFIWVTTGLVGLCAGRGDEIAFVLGHEMAHVIRKHAMDRLLANSVLDLAMRVTPARGMLQGQLSGILRQLLEQRYSQDQELEADAFAVRIVSAAGFPPEGAIRFFERLKPLVAEPPGIGQYFSSHPPFDQRIARVRRALRA